MASRAQGRTGEGRQTTVVSVSRRRTSLPLHGSTDHAGHDIADHINVADRAGVFLYGHRLRKKVTIGVRSEKVPSFLMPARGFVSGLFWYAVISQIIVGIPAAIVGMILGMLGG